MKTSKGSKGNKWYNNNKNAIISESKYVKNLSLTATSEIKINPNIPEVKK